MRYNVLIIGGGSAGAILATRLSEDAERSILLLEAGPDYRTFESLPDSVKEGNNPWRSCYGPDAHSWGYLATAREGREPFIVPRGKVMGGSSAINGQVFFRGIPQDYDEWAELGNNEWAFRKILPFFNKSETDLDFEGGDFHGVEGPIPVRRTKKDELVPTARAFYEACISEGYPETLDHNHPESTGIGARPLNNVNGIRMSTDVTYLNLARHRMNLTIRGDVMVLRILFEGNKAVAVQAKSGEDTFVIEADEIILSAGAINSPQLLMLSGIGSKEHLSGLGIDVIKDLPGVGENLRDHPMVFMLYQSDADPDDESVPANVVGMRYTIPGSKYPNDMQMGHIRMSSEHRDAGVPIDDEKGYMGFSVALQKAKTAGWLRLASKNPFEQPLLNYNYLSDSWDLERMKSAVRLCVKITENREFDKAPVRRILPTDEDLSSDENLGEWILSNVITQHHSSGTCKMGPLSDPMSVVNQYGRVHGIEGLSVVDASIMPDVVRANTNATVVMIAERVAEWWKN